MGNPVYGECARHKGHSMIDCPICEMKNQNSHKFVFDILRNDTIVLPPCDSASGKSAVIDTLKPKTKYVFVTYDPLLEQVVCVHEKQNTECPKCKALRKKRWDSKNPYFLETSKFKIKP